jgi:hypothetical protein
MLNESQIRYCLAEIIRIEAVRPVLDRFRHDQVEFFNNSRCAKYRFEVPAMDRAKRDVETHRAQIETAAQHAFAQRFSGPPKAAEQGVIAAAPQPAEARGPVKAAVPAAEHPPAAVAAAPTQPHRPRNRRGPLRHLRGRSSQWPPRLRSLLRRRSPRP